MENILLFDQSIPEINLKIRKPTNGSEYHLVEQFIDYKVSRFQSQKKPENQAGGLCRTIFRNRLS